jgi:hypothetical protein
VTLPLASMRYRDAMHRPLGLACALLSACGPSPGEESTTDAPASTTGAAASTGEPTTTTTIDTPTTTGDSTPTSTTSAGPTPTTSPDDDTSTGGTTGAPGQCGPPCDAPWIHEGDLEINAKTDPESLRCLVEVTKSLQISGLPGQLPPQLGNLRRVGRNVEVNYSDALTSLAGLDCLEAVGELQLVGDPLLADLSATANITAMGGLWIRDCPQISDLSLFDGVSGLLELFLAENPALTRLPVPGPDSELARLMIRDCDALTDLDALAGVPGTDEFLEVELKDNAALASVAGVADLWPPTVGFAAVHLISLPALTSLEGLVGIEGADFRLRDLPLVSDLEPLAGPEWFDRLDLDGMPKLVSLAPLAGLRQVGRLLLGSCSEPGGQGLDGLKDPSGLEGVEFLDSLTIARNDALTELPVFSPNLGPLSEVALIGNAALTEAATLAFVATHGGCAEPPDKCQCPEDKPMP